MLSFGSIVSKSNHPTCWKLPLFISGGLVSKLSYTVRSISLPKTVRQRSPTMGNTIIFLLLLKLLDPTYGALALYAVLLYSIKLF